MCPIGGVFSRNNESVSAQINAMVDTLYHKGSAEAWQVSGGISWKWRRDAHLVTRSAAVGQALVQASFATRERPTEKPAFDCSGKLSVLYEGNLYNDEYLRAVLNPAHQLSIGSAAEIVAHLLEERYQGNLRTALREVASLMDGDYCLVASDGGETVLMRDCAGRRPAFYAENNELIAFASQKKALWKIGLRNVKPLRAGTLASFKKGDISIEEAGPLGKIEVIIDNLTVAVDSYCLLLRAAVEKRLHNLKRVGVLISGGVDSCLIAKLVSDVAAPQGIEVVAYTAGMDGAIDIWYAERFAQELGMSHKVRRLYLDDVESYIPQVATAVEERELVQIEAGIAVYVAVEMASQNSIKVIFSGQGPDELWGGYSWYPQVIARDGYEGLQQKMWGDLERADIETLDRENRIAMAHGVEKVFPYIDTEVVKLAMSVSPHLKISSAEDHIGKRPHRQAAKRLGVPPEYADRGKDAAQHGTGIHDTLEEIARKNGFTPELVRRIGYRSEEISEEKLASSARYGYLYAERELWEVADHVQLFVDSVAYKNNLLNELDRTKIREFLKEAGVDRR